MASSSAAPPFEEGITYQAPGAAVPAIGNAIGLIITMSSISLLSIFIFTKINSIKRWRNLSPCLWITFAIYFDSLFFVVAVTILEQIVGLNSSPSACQAAIWVCLASYITTKFIYLFLVEKAHIIRNCGKSRLQSKLYCFNAFGLVTVYVVIGILNMIYRTATINEHGVCVIGMKKAVMIPLISFDAFVNVYLTALFMIPLHKLYSFRDTPKTEASARLQVVATRTCIGCFGTLISSVANLFVLMILDGEPGWVCFMCCTIDVLFSAIVIQWVTSKDNRRSKSSRNSCPREYRSSPIRTKFDLEKGEPRHIPKPSSTPTDEICLVETSPYMRTDPNANGSKILVTTTISYQSECGSGSNAGILNHESELNPVYFPRDLEYGIQDEYYEIEQARTHHRDGSK